MAWLDSSFADDHQDRQSIRCIHCGCAQQVSRRALTVTCKSCSKTLKIEPISIRRYQARRAIETCGALTIEKRGNVLSDRILCGELVVRGSVRAEVICSQGPVRVAPGGRLTGDVTAPSLAVADGAILHGRYRIGPNP
jgi:Polymer-forming cytoskeletal